MTLNAFDETIEDMKNLAIERNFVKNNKSMIEEAETCEECRKKEGWFDFKTPVIWPNVIGIFGFHLIAIYGLFTLPMMHYKLLTLWGELILGFKGFFLGGIAGFGVTGGAHRFWTHRTYKAKLPLRIILLISYLLAGENSVYDWVRDHRVHHKYTESDADPHDSRRGFFFSHVGWLMMKKHPEVLRRGRQVDMSDVLADPVVQFSQKYFTILKILVCFVLPTVIPVYFWNQPWYPAIMSQVFIRYATILNFTWSVNSFAHLWGYRRYDRTISPVENKMVAWVSMGEGWHNYHHVFPWDYKAAELGSYWLNLTTMFIDIFAKIGWAYDLKTASDDLIRKVTEKRGDGSHPLWGDSREGKHEH